MSVGVILLPRTPKIEKESNSTPISFPAKYSGKIEFYNIYSLFDNENRNNP